MRGVPGRLRFFAGPLRQAQRAAQTDTRVVWWLCGAPAWRDGGSHRRVEISKPARPWSYVPVISRPEEAQACDTSPRSSPVWERTE